MYIAQEYPADDQGDETLRSYQPILPNPVLNFWVFDSLGSSLKLGVPCLGSSFFYKGAVVYLGPKMGP